MIEVFFNRPRLSLSCAKLLQDIRQARETVVLASAWFTDTEIARAFIASPATNWKLAILNRADIDRGEKRAYQLLQEAYQQDRIVLKILGGSDWQKGIMHHKFCLVDDQITWLGSMNFTFQARRNYEALVRIEDAALNATFWQEAENMLHEGMIIADEPSTKEWPCYDCEQIFQEWQMCWRHYPAALCAECCTKREEHD